MAMEFGSAFGATAFGISVPSFVELLQYEWFLNENVKKGLTILQAELKSMHIFLGDVSSLAPNLQLHRQMKLQADEVSDLSHSIGTCLHSFMARIESTKGKVLPDTGKHFINHEIDKYIKEARNKVKDLRVRHGPYPVMSTLESNCTRKVDPRILAMCTTDPYPVGIAGAIADLTEKLSKSDHVSIVGMGGLGKTTLARAVYDKMKMKGGFDCDAFVPIRHSAGPEKVLKDIFDGLRIEIYGKDPDEYQLANQLRDVLKKNRCLIVFDDLRDKETWTMIKDACAGSVGSKIITTTRNSQIPEGVDGVIYKIKSLSHDDSRKLLHTKIFRDDLLSDKILRKCGVVPMAITVIGRFLATKQRSEWRRVHW